MAEASDRVQSRPSACEPFPEDDQLSPEDRDELQATELAQMRSNYNRASSNHLQGTRPVAISVRPTQLGARLAYNVKRFWQHQVSVTVDHECCRDHLERRIQSVEQPPVTCPGAQSPAMVTRYRRCREQPYHLRGLDSQAVLDSFHLFDMACWVKVFGTSSTNAVSLERTFLGYLRTSLALSMIGITVAQLFRLQHAPTPNSTFGYFVLSKPLACICQGAAIYTLLIGAFRTWRQQNAMVRGKAISGGFELIFLGAGIFTILCMFFVLLVAVNISKEV